MAAKLILYIAYAKHTYNMKKIYIALFIILAASSHIVSQCMLTPITLAERVNNSSLIIEGQVISKKSFWNPEHNYIHTSNLIQVKQILKGSGKSAANLSFIEVITAGGEIGDRRLTVEPALFLTEGQEGVFTLNQKNFASQFGHATFEVYADDQGFIKFDKVDNSANDHFNTYADINNDLYKAIGTIMNAPMPFYNNPQAKLTDPSAQVAAVSGISPSSISAGTGSILTITGTGFGAGYSTTNYVEFRNADDGGSTWIGAHASQYVSWTPTQIQVKVPTRTNGSGTAGTGQVRVVTPSGSTVSPTNLTVTYGHLNLISPSPTTAASVVYNTRHVNDNGSGGYTWRYSTNFSGNAPAVASFTRALTTWTCGTYINWTIGTPTSIIVVASDGVNIVRFDDAANPLPGGVLGRCSSWWSGCGSNPNMNWFVVELDIEFDNATNWQYGPANATGSQIDFESVAVHELGHGHQLSHVINSVDVMHYSIGPAQNKRTLNVDDLAGGNSVMTRNLSGGVCSQGVMTQMSSASCTTLVPTASFVISPTLVCTGQVVSLTDQSTNGPNTWTWTLTGGTPASSNAQNPTVTYATAGTKTITLICSNANGPSTALSKTLTVVASPTISVGSASICPTKSATLTASGSSGGYTWTPGPLTGATQVLSPPITQVYNVVGTNGTCTNSTNGTVTVLPGANPSVSSSTICAGSQIVKTATGATNYTWNPGNLTGASQTLSPGSTTTYTVLGSVGTCTGTTTFVISTTTVLTGVNITPATTTLCVGQTTILTASGATTYTWNTSATTNTLLVSASATSVYVVTGQTGNCQGTASSTVTVASCAGITQNTEFISSIYPNPTQGAVIMKFAYAFSGELAVHNALGQLIFEKKLNNVNEYELDISTQSNGVYMLKLRNGNGAEKILKVIKE